ncbi:MAG: hypothetical protein V5A38_01010 [Halolamina sp.]|uniref:hypothetical protein n=1 Tax=Halolamina sp. TaxID=1940283 RepID=UPI002FC2FF57
MDFTPRQTFWLALCWLGVAQSLNWGLAILRVGVWPGNAAALAGSGLLTLVAAVGVLRPETLGGPTERSAPWVGAVAAAALATVALLL